MAVRRISFTPLTPLARCTAIMLVFLVAGCANDLSDSDVARQNGPPNVMPARQVSSATLRLQNSSIQPMYRQRLTVDLEAVVRVASLDNVGILEAQQRVEASHGQLEAAAAAVLPVVGPGVALTHLQGVDINNLGVLQAAHFTTLNPAILVHWAVNPGQVYFDVVASKKRLHASGEQERSVVMQTVQTAALKYYDLVLAQARVAVAREALGEAEELLRLAGKRVDSGFGLPVDVIRSRAALASRQQTLAVALNGFYKASVALAATLYLDPVVTLVPRSRALAARSLVRDDLGIEQMLNLAVQWRPDLQSVRDLAAAAGADTSKVIWGAGLPTLQAGFQPGQFGSWTPGKTFLPKGQEISAAGIGWVFNPTVFGQAKTAGAYEQISELEVKRLIQQVGDDVVISAQDSATNAGLIPIAKQQVTAAEEALHITQENFEAGTALFLDILQAQDAVLAARLNYANAITSYNQSQVNLLTALGLIDQANVAAVPPQITAATRKQAKLRRAN
jgi:multidrug efflux system outer membrane protein